MEFGTVLLMAWCSFVNKYRRPRWWIDRGFSKL